MWEAQIVSWFAMEAELREPGLYEAAASDGVVDPLPHWHAPAHLRLRWWLRFGRVVDR